MILTLLGIWGCGSESLPDSGLDPVVCNGAANHCDRPFNHVPQITTHNAYSNAEDGFALPTPNQEVGITQQLDDGVRSLMLDTYEWQDDLYLCHGVCGSWGARLLSDTLAEIHTWLEANPNDVVSFILEAYITEDQTWAALEASGLDAYVYEHAGLGEPWPTLNEMINANQRLVVFTDDANANGTWHLNWTAHGWETPFDDATFTCENGRGEPGGTDNQIFILNHYRTCEVGGCPENGETDNTYNFLLQRAKNCWEDTENNPANQIPTFINLDHYHVPNAGPDSECIESVQAALSLSAMWESD